MEVARGDDEPQAEKTRAYRISVLGGVPAKVRRAAWLLAVGAVMMLAAQAGCAIAKNRWGCAIVLTALAVGIAGIVVAKLWW